MILGLLINIIDIIIITNVCFFVHNKKYFALITNTVSEITESVVTNNHNYQAPLRTKWASQNKSWQLPQLFSLHYRHRPWIYQNPSYRGGLWWNQSETKKHGIIVSDPTVTSQIFCGCLCYICRFLIQGELKQAKSSINLQKIELQSSYHQSHAINYFSTKVIWIWCEFCQNSISLFGK